MGSTYQEERPTFELSLLISIGTVVSSVAAGNVFFRLCIAELTKLDERLVHFDILPFTEKSWAPIVISVYLGSVALRTRHWFFPIALGAMLIAWWIPVMGAGMGSGDEAWRMLQVSIRSLRIAAFCAGMALDAGLIILVCEHRRSVRRDSGIVSERKPSVVA